MGKILLIQVKVPNIVPGSAPLLQKKWVKVKCAVNEEQQYNQLSIEKDNALEIAHAIIQGQLKSQ